MMVDDLRAFARAHPDAAIICNDAADILAGQYERSAQQTSLLESQAKALSEAEAENARLASALKGLSDMYASTWDRVDGALMMMDDGVKRFERAHGVAYKLLEARKLKPRAFTNAAKEKT